MPIGALPAYGQRASMRVVVMATIGALCGDLARQAFVKDE